MNEALKQSIIREVRSYLRDDIDEFDARARCALGEIGRYRAPLFCVDATLNQEIIDSIECWFHDNFETDDFL